jgi:hypothetical protein
VTDLLAQLVVWLNAAANAVGRVVLAPVGVLPGWLSATLAAAATGVLLLVVFKYTSPQRAIKRVRADIKAHLLALKLFKDSTAVALRAQGRILLGALRLLLLSVVPLLVMVLPACLILGQLGLWYQSRPLRVGEDALVTLQLGGDAGSPWPDVYLEPTGALDVLVGPVRVRGKREVCWGVRAREAGYHRLVFRVGDQAIDKELAVGDGFMRVSPKRPGWDFEEALRYPGEEPFRPDSPVRSVEIDYPERPSWTSGTDWWVAYWFVVSLAAGFCFRGWLKVNI